VIRVIGRKLDQEWRRLHDPGATENDRGSFRGISATSRPDVKFPAICGYAPAAVYLPREVFFGRLALAGAFFFSVCASDFGRFFTATSGSFR
jgi:hypothetical protein